MRLSPEQAAAIMEHEREQIPLKWRGNPDDVARWIVSLADPASEWVTGQVIAVDALVARAAFWRAAPLGR